PDLKVTAVRGKTFVPDSTKIVQLKGLEGVNALSFILEENAPVQYQDKTDIFRLKGVDENFTKVSDIDTAMIDGEFLLSEPSDFEGAEEGDMLEYAILGSGVRQILGINVNNPFAQLRIYMPYRKSKIKTGLPTSNFNVRHIKPNGVFSIQQDFDLKYVIVPISFARRLMQIDEAVSAIEIDIDDNANPKRVKEAVAQVLGADFRLQDRYQQDEVVYKMMQSEKWWGYVVLSFVLLIAAFNIIGSLSMVVIEKKHDISILKAMGATNKMVRRIFLTEGLLIGLVSATVGTALAGLICWLQQTFGIVKMGGASFLLDAYPVSMRFSDFALIFVTVVAIATLAAFFPAQRAAAQSQLIKGD
ncbi:MAG: ABC transporter permease, partial [Chitinophagales bacterium]